MPACSRDTPYIHSRYSCSQQGFCCRTGSCTCGDYIVYQGYSAPLKRLDGTHLKGTLHALLALALALAQ